MSSCTLRKMVYDFLFIHFKFRQFHADGSCNTDFFRVLDLVDIYSSLSKNITWSNYPIQKERTWHTSDSIYLKKNPSTWRIWTHWYLVGRRLLWPNFKPNWLLACSYMIRSQILLKNVGRKIFKHSVKDKERINNSQKAGCRTTELGKTKHSSEWHAS